MKEFSIKYTIKICSFTYIKNKVYFEFYIKKNTLNVTYLLSMAVSHSVAMIVLRPKQTNRTAISSPYYVEDFCFLSMNEIDDWSPKDDGSGKAAVEWEKSIHRTRKSAKSSMTASCVSLLWLREIYLQKKYVERISIEFYCLCRKQFYFWFFSKYTSIITNYLKSHYVLVLLCLKNWLPFFFCKILNLWPIFLYAVSQLCI